MFYLAIERFDCSIGERFEGYVRWLGRTDLVRVVTLDNQICPPVVHVEDGADWEFVVHEEFMLDFFTDLDFVLRRVAEVQDGVVIAVAREPSAEDVASFPHPGFEFAGFEVVDARFTASVLLNHNRFSGLLNVSELSAKSGLVLSRERAFEIRDTVRRNYPDREDTNCNVWAVWRYLGRQRRPQS